MQKCRVMEIGKLFFTSMNTKVTDLGTQVINIHLLGNLIAEIRCDKQRQYKLPEGS